MAEAFNMQALERLLKSLQGTGSEDKALKAQSKSQQELAKLNGEIQKQLAEQQSQYAQALAAQQAAASLEAERSRQEYERPFQEAGLTGYYNGNQTLQGQQLATTIDQFNRQFSLNSEIERRQISLAELTQQQQNAVAQGNLDLAREIQTRQVQLQAEQQAAQQELDRIKTSGFMENGNLTEEARQARFNEANQRAQTMGFYMPSYAEVIPEGNIGGFGYNDERSYHAASMMAEQAGTLPQGQMTDEAQKWRAQAGLEYARTAAQLSSNPADYFESAAYMRNAGNTGALGFLDAINKNGLGSNVGFRTGAGATPQTNSMANVAGTPTPAFMGNPVSNSPTGPQPTTGRNAAAPTGASPSLTRAENVSNGTEDVYTTMMHTNEIAPQVKTYTPPASPGPSPIPAFVAGASPSSVNPQSIVPGSPPIGVSDPVAERLSAFQPLFRAGAHKLQAGALESLSPTERGLFQSAAKASGVNPEDYEQSYKRSHTFNTENARKA